MDITKVNIKPFDGNDFTLWKWQVETYLKAAKLEKVVNGPAEGERAASDEEENKFNLVLSQTLTREQLIHVVSLPTGKEKWDRLKAIHDSSSADMVQKLYTEFFSMAPDDGADLASYISRVQTVVVRLREQRHEIKDDLIVAHILSKLPEQYATFVVSWQSTTKAERTMDNLTNRLLAEQMRLNAGRSEDAAFFARKGKKPDARKQAGGSQFSGRGARGSSSGSFPYKCFGCGRVGHRVSECREKRNTSHEQQASSSQEKQQNRTPGNGKRDAAFSAVCLTASPMKWYMDSGASSHVCPVKEWFTDMKEVNSCLVLADGRKMPIKGIGTVEVWTATDKGRIKMPITDVLYAPDGKYCLFSLTVVEDKGFEVQFRGRKCFVKYNGQTKAVGNRDGSLYVMDFCIESERAMVAESNVGLEQWHRRLAHVHMQKVAKAIGWKGQPDPEFKCEGCIYGKTHRKSFPKKTKKRETKPGAVVHADLAGPMRERSITGAKYFLLLKDDCSGLQFVYFLKEKNQVASRFKDFLVDWSSVSERPVQRLRSDNGTEFVGRDMVKLCAEHLIKTETSTPYTPQQNGTIERAIRTVTEAARSMIHGADVPLYLWSEAVANAVHVLNRIPSYDMVKSPLEIVSGTKVDIGYLREFGSKAFAHIRDQQRTKWDPKAKEMTLVGYNGGQKSYRLWDRSGRRIVHSRDVTIIEPTTPFERQLPAETEQESESSDEEHDSDEDRESEDEEAEDEEPRDGAPPAKPVRVVVDTHQQASSSKVVTPVTAAKPGAPVQRSRSEGSGLRPILRRSYKETTLNTKTSSPKKGGKESTCQSHFAGLAFDLGDEPPDYQSAMASEDCAQWQEAVKEEMDDLEKTETWDIILREPRMNVVRNKWVFRIKRKADGSVDRYKARLVAKGFSQKQGIDYNETFSPVVRYDTVRILLSLVPAMDLHVTQFDVKTAFLNGTLDEEVFMEIPEGFEAEGDMVCRLKKSLYGLKQSPRQWTSKLKEVMGQFGLNAIVSDPCVFVSGDKTLIVCCYVDDGLIFWRDEAEKDRLIKGLKSKFDISIGDGSAYAGMQIEYRDGAVFVHQEYYLQRVLKRFGMEDCIPASCPAKAHVILRKNEDDESVDVPYRELVGSLMYLAVVSRPDIAYAVSVLSQYMSCFSLEHWTAGKEVLRYLKSSPKLGLLFDGTDGCLVAYSDSDWAGDTDTRRSRTGNVILLNGSAVIWTSQRQPIVTLSSSEAEFVAANSAVTSIKWMTDLLVELGVELEEQVLLMDNQPAIKMIKNPEFHMRTKHIDIRYKFIRERYNEELFSLDFVRSEDQLADFLTKPLPPAKFKRNVEMIMFGSCDDVQVITSK